VLPKPVRDQLQLRAGDSLDLETSDDRVTLRPSRPRGRMYKKQGVWVFDSGSPLSAETVDETVRQVRSERDAHNSGKAR
jgi:AbrB family looped-hinge helix DNA binding protein